MDGIYKIKYIKEEAEEKSVSSLWSDPIGKVKIIHETQGWEADPLVAIN